MITSNLIVKNDRRTGRLRVARHVHEPVRVARALVAPGRRLRPRDRSEVAPPEDLLPDRVSGWTQGSSIAACIHAVGHGQDEQDPAALSGRTSVIILGTSRNRSCLRFESACAGGGAQNQHKMCRAAQGMLAAQCAAVEPAERSGAGSLVPTETENASGVESTTVRHLQHGASGGTDGGRDVDGFGFRRVGQELVWPLFPARH